MLSEEFVSYFEEVKEFAEQWNGTDYSELQIIKI